MVGLHEAEGRPYISMDRLGGRAVLIGEVRNRPESIPDPNGQGQCAVGSDRLPGRCDGREGVLPALRPCPGMLLISIE